MITVHLLYSGGHVHSLKTMKEDLVSSLVIAKNNGDRVMVIFDEDEDHEVAMIDLIQLQMAWETKDE